MVRIQPGTIVRAQVGVPTFSGPTRDDLPVGYIAVGSLHLVIATDERTDDKHHNLSMALILPLRPSSVSWAYMKHMVPVIEAPQ